ncbi:CaiB/BaiF CoA transferase family protein [Jannaschia pohangensis]|uniref:Crotonobetainyl-CoA:carnitine CoA-transferase CaiB n=1 Tax=Jannaschia pohangensis TaxID=390807 RepID=A0A1I3GQA1_9RHOB|nr:CoA transferase [Jannaschia pohangensis]SFI25564.1 Crotonobetainyl-CoA:carnitine CoA-transferase CaiB [Jannaschia pohangensis]
MSSPLTGVRVIDFTHVLAGPACAYYLGLLGAEVIKVERPLRGDAMRHRGGTDPARAARGMSTAYVTQAAGKAAITLDLESTEGRGAMRDLLRSADVFVENHRPATLRALDLDEGRTLALNPRLIHCAMTGYGRGGPNEDAPAYDVNIQATSGIMTLTGTKDTGPLRTGAPIMDYSVALAAGFAIAAALFEREKTGKGTFIDVSMLDTAYTLMSSTITDFVATGNVPAARGNAANSRSPGAGSFPCKEGVLSLGVNEESQFRALAIGLGRAEWLDDQRFADRRIRNRNAPALEEALIEVLAQRTADAWETHLLACGVPVAKVRTLPESLETPHSKARGYLWQDEQSGLTVPGLPFRIGQSGAHRPRGTIRDLDADTETILAQIRRGGSEEGAS